MLWVKVSAPGHWRPDEVQDLLQEARVVVSEMGDQTEDLRRCIRRHNDREFEFPFCVGPWSIQPPQLTRDPEIFTLPVQSHGVFQFTRTIPVGPDRSVSR